MRHKIFANILIGVILVFLICFSVVVYEMYGFFSNYSRHELNATANALASAINQYGADFLESADTGEYQFIYTSADNKVIYSSDGDAEGRVQSYTKLLKDGSTLCVYGAEETIVSVVINMRYHILTLFIMVCLLSVILANNVSKSVIRPINEIDIENPDDATVYKEIRPLVKRINAQNRQIKQQMDELKEEHEKQNKLRREFTANVSHELKTPLTSISGYAEIMRDGVAKQEDVSRFSGIIYDETQHLINLVSDIIDLSKLEEKDNIYEKKNIDLYEISKNVISRLTPIASKRGINFQLTGISQILYGTETIIDEIIYNLCDNAIKYNKDNGLVMINVRNVNRTPEITVTDTGIGIPKEELDRVFERFYRVDKSHTSGIGGTGLGLSIVKHGVSYHGGEVSIKSELGSGTSVKIRFTNRI